MPIPWFKFSDTDNTRSLLGFFVPKNSLYHSKVNSWCVHNLYIFHEVFLQTLVFLEKTAVGWYNIKEKLSFGTAWNVSGGKKHETHENLVVSACGDSFDFLRSGNLCNRCRCGKYRRLLYLGRRRAGVSDEFWNPRRSSGCPTRKE